MVKRILGLALLSVLLFSVPCAALQVEAGDDIMIPAGTVINDNLFVAGGDIAVSGTVKGDLIIVGGDVEVEGYVEGNIMACGGNVRMKGSARNVYIGGGDVSIAGTVRKDLVVGAGNVSVSPTARIWKDAYLGCGNAKIAGRVYRDLKVGAGSLEIASGAYVQGKVDHSASEVDISDKARIVGPITSYAQPTAEKGAGPILGGFFAFHRIVKALAFLLLGALIIIYMPNQVRLVTGKMKDECWKSFFWGILSIVVIPLAAILLCVTLIGMPLAVVLMALYVFGIYITGIFVSIVIGKWILDKLGKTKLSLIWSLALGLLILNVVGVVPVLGWIACVLLFLWGFGALVQTRFTTYKNARSKGVL